MTQTAIIRNFMWDDFDAMCDVRAVINGVPDERRAAARSALRSRLELPGFDPTQDAFIAEAGGIVIGCAIAAVETAIDRTVGEFGVLPGSRGAGLGHRLLSRLEERAVAAGTPDVHVNIPHGDTTLRGLVEAAGYRHIRTYNELSYRPAPAYLAGDYRPLPAGISLRAFRPGSDEATLADVQNAAFEGSFGFAPNTPEQIAGYVAMRGEPGDILMAVDDSTGETVGYVWTSVEDSPGETTGMIEMTGVYPARRGRGIGTAVIAAGLRHLRERGAGLLQLEVDDENLSARRIYRELGFKKVGEQLWYGKTVTG